MMRPYLGAALACALLASLAACGRNAHTAAASQPDAAQQPDIGPGRIAPAPRPADGPPRDYLKSQQSDAQRAMDSMPAPTGGNGQ